MSYWIKRESGAAMTTDRKPATIFCMHKSEGCVPSEGVPDRGLLNVWHDEPEPFKLPRGHRHECAYCRRNGPPATRELFDISSHYKVRGGSAGPGGGASVAVTAYPKSGY